MTYSLRNVVGVLNVAKGKQVPKALLLDYDNWPYWARKLYDYVCLLLSSLIASLFYHFLYPAMGFSSNLMRHLVLLVPLMTIALLLPSPSSPSLPPSLLPSLPPSLPINWWFKGDRMPRSSLAGFCSSLLVLQTSVPQYLRWGHRVPCWMDF